MTEDDDEVLLEVRTRSHQSVQTVFAGLGILATAAGLAVRHYALDLGLADLEPEAIANCFLCMGASYTLTLVIWDWLYERA